MAIRVTRARLVSERAMNSVYDAYFPSPATPGYFIIVATLRGYAERCTRRVEEIFAIKTKGRTAREVACSRLRNGTESCRVGIFLCCDSPHVHRESIKSVRNGRD